jgi:hypothetical protein
LQSIAGASPYVAKATFNNWETYLSNDNVPLPMSTRKPFITEEEDVKKEPQKRFEGGVEKPYRSTSIY